MKKKMMSVILAVTTVATMLGGAVAVQAEEKDKLVVYGIYKAGDQTWFIDEGAAAVSYTHLFSRYVQERH